MNQNIENVCQKIAVDFDVRKIIVFSVKHDLSGKVMSFKICVVSDCDPQKIERDIYCCVESDVPYDVICYHSEDFERMIKDGTSFASRINETGAVHNG